VCRLEGPETNTHRHTQTHKNTQKHTHARAEEQQVVPTRSLRVPVLQRPGPDSETSEHKVGTKESSFVLGRTGHAPSGCDWLSEPSVISATDRCDGMCLSLFRNVVIIIYYHNENT